MEEKEIAWSGVFMHLGCAAVIVCREVLSLLYSLIERRLGSKKNITMAFWLKENWEAKNINNILYFYSLSFTKISILSPFYPFGLPMSNEQISTRNIDSKIFLTLLFF